MEQKVAKIALLHFIALQYFLDNAPKIRSLHQVANVWSFVTSSMH